MRIFLFVILLLCGLAAIVTGFLVPSHLRAVDPFVLRHLPLGKTLVELATETASHNPPVAKMLVMAAEELELSGTENALDALREGQGRSTERTVLGQLEAEQAGRARVPEVPVLVALRPAAARARLTDAFQSTEARRVLENRNITNTTLFAPVKSAAGFPFEAAILTTAFLVERRAFEPGLHAEVLRLTAQGSVEEIEDLYLNVLALAKRFSSAQIAGLVAHIPTTSALDTICRAIQNSPAATPVIYSAVVASREGAGLAEYLRTFPKTGLEDITTALSRGSEPLQYLLRAKQPVFRSTLYREFAASRALRNIFEPLLELATRSPVGAALLKFFLLTLGAVCLVASSRFARRHESSGQYVLFGPLSLIRRAAATVVVLMLLVILGEPYLAQGSAEQPPRPRVTFSLAALTAPPPPTTPSNKAMLDQHTVLAIATFLILQGLIYAICLVKLAEIRKQPVSSATKLKLLDNEENLFDGGLYCGLFGTAASLILLTLGVIKPSLISAYSSTLFGILFVALIKIVHVRPYKRRLLLETPEPEPAATATPAGNPFSNRA